MIRPGTTYSSGARMPAARMTIASTSSGSEHDEANERDPRAEEDGDHDDRADVVDHGEAEEQNPQTRGHSRSEQREHADGERDVGRHRDRPARCAATSDVQRREDRSRDEHPADGRGERKRSLAERGQLALEDLAPDLETHDEEEDRHQPLVHPEVKGLVVRPRSDADTDRRVPQRRIRCGPDVGPQQGDAGHHQKDDTARRFDGQDALDRSGESLGGTANGADDLGRMRLFRHVR